MFCHSSLSISTGVGLAASVSEIEAVETLKAKREVRAARALPAHSPSQRLQHILHNTNLSLGLGLDFVYSQSNSDMNTSNELPRASPTYSVSNGAY